MAEQRIHMENMPATMPVSGNVAVSNFPATQPVSGTVAASNLANPHPVSGTVNVGNFPATQPVSGAIGVNNFPATQPVSGSVSVSNFPATQVVAPAVPASSDIRGASASATGTLVTIPAGRTFRGSVSLSCSVSVAGNNQPTISVSGTGVVPSGTIHQITAAGLALSTITNSNTLDDVYIYGGSAGATVTFTAGANGQSMGQIAGILL